MFVYRDDHCLRLKPREALARISQHLHNMMTGSATHEQALELLIEYGDMENALQDSLHPRHDEVHEVSDILRSGGLATGEILAASWEGKPDRIRAAAATLSKVIASLQTSNLEGDVPTRIPEGFAFYGLYPETYMQAARTFVRDVRPERVVCIGLRTIGTSLSSVVTATLKNEGVEVTAFTLRPHGHPFRREPSLGPGLKRTLAAQHNCWYAIVDEGPGLSGSSLCGTARVLGELGIPDERIVFFPSWIPNTSMFVNEDARSRWSKHTAYTGSFEECWIKTNKLSGSFPAHQSITDISGGLWRSALFEKEDLAQAVHPFLERRKYWGQPQQPGSHQGAFIAKFAGLGKYGREKFARAQELYEAGFCPRPLGFQYGFIIYKYIPHDEDEASAITGDLLDTAARYLAHLRTDAPAPYEGSSWDTLWDMIEENATEALGEKYRENIQALRESVSPGEDAQPSAIDGRMHPYKWIRSGERYLKMDATDHHLDQFLPGCQDVAWDMAGMLSEGNLTTLQRQTLIETYARVSGDRAIVTRLPFYSLAYDAFKLGYATLARQALGESIDGKRFKFIAQKAALHVRRHLERLSVQTPALVEVGG